MPYHPRARPHDDELSDIDMQEENDLFGDVIKPPSTQGHTSYNRGGSSSSSSSSSSAAALARSFLKPKGQEVDVDLLDDDPESTTMHDEARNQLKGMKPFQMEATSIGPRSQHHKSMILYKEKLDRDRKEK